MKGYNVEETRKNQWSKKVKKALPCRHYIETKIKGCWNISTTNLEEKRKQICERCNSRIYVKSENGKYYKRGNTNNSKHEKIS